jgi:tyrosyl-tRNA synthetase
MLCQHRRTFDGTNACGVCGIDQLPIHCIGHLVVMLLKHFQLAGHKPLALVVVQQE